MVQLSDLFLLIELSDLLSLLLIIVTLFTVRYASKTLLMEYSSQIIISKHRMKGSDHEKVYTWEVDLENKGRGYVVKSFILLTIKQKRLFATHIYHLSEPIVDIEPGEKDTITLSLNNENFAEVNFSNKNVWIDVYYQDALNNIYVVSPGPEGTNKQLESFEKLPKKIIFLTPRYFAYKYKFRKAVKQENTSINRQNHSH